MAADIPQADIEQVLQAHKTGQYKNLFWRLENLYRVKDVRTGDPIKPVLTPDQRILVRQIWDENFPTKRHVILKARQVFMTTISVLLALDLCVHKKHTTALMSSYTEDDTTNIFREKTSFIVGNSPLLRFNEVVAHQASVLFPRTGSSYHISGAGRGSNPNFTHITEYGKTCSFFPHKAEEMRRGLFPASEYHPIIIESTSMGAGGDFYELCKNAHRKQLSGHQLDRLSFKFHFLAWWSKEQNRIGGHYDETPEQAAYYKDVERQMNIVLEPSQRAWFASTLEHTFHGNSLAMMQENPSTVDEAFVTDTESKILLKEMKAMRDQQRIHDFPRNEKFPLLVFWDFGKSDATAFIVAQRDPEGYIFILDAFQRRNMPLRSFLGVIASKGHVVLRHILPHDAAAIGGSVSKFHSKRANKSIREAFSEFGQNNTFVLPRIATKQHGFEASRAQMHRIHIHSRLTELTGALEAVEKRYQKEARIYLDQLTPHAPNNHFYDCVEAACRLAQEYPGYWTGEVADPNANYISAGEPEELGYNEIATDDDHQGGLIG